jgi:hypothetical protein
MRRDFGAQFSFHSLSLAIEVGAVALVASPLAMLVVHD